MEDSITKSFQGNVDATKNYTQFGSHHLISGSANHSTQAQTNNHSDKAENKESKEDTASQPQKMQRENRNWSSAPQTSSMALALNLKDPSPVQDAKKNVPLKLA